MIHLYFIRHLPTQSNLKNLWCGRKTNISVDPVATTKILNNSQLKGLANMHFDYVFVSPLNRCIETIKYLQIKQKHIIEPRIIEREFGFLENQSCDDGIKEKLADWNLNTDLNLGVEKIQDLYYKRLLPFLKDIQKLPDKSSVLVISHSWIGRLLKFYISKNLSDIQVAPKNGEILDFAIEKA